MLHWQTGVNAKAQWAVRRGDWKLIGNPMDPVHPDTLTKDDALFLSNPVDDPSESRNLAADHPETVRELRALHEAWLAQMGKP